MPPKSLSGSVGAAALTQNEMEFVATVLQQTEAIQVNWKNVAEIHNINRPSNATAKFQGTLKKWGLKLVKGKFVSLDADEADAAAAGPASMTADDANGNGAQATPVKKRTRGPNKRKKATPNDSNVAFKTEDTEDMEPTPTKKAKVADGADEDGAAALAAAALQVEVDAEAEA